MTSKIFPVSPVDEVMLSRYMILGTFEKCETVLHVPFFGLPFECANLFGIPLQPYLTLD